MVRRLFWKLYLTHLLVVLICTGAVGWYAIRSVRGFYESDVAGELEAKARLISGQVSERLAAPKRDELEGLCKALGSAAHLRITVVLPDGKVIADSEKDPAQMENHADRQEIRQALAAQVGKTIHRSRTLEADMMYVAFPLRTGDRIIGVVRTSVALTDVSNALAAIYRSIALAAIGVAILGIGLSLSMSRRISRPLEEIKKGAERFAKGEFGSRLPLSDTEEIAGLATVLNQMAAQLDEKIRAIVQQRNEREAILTSMVEGVVALDKGQRIIELNQAAAGLMGVDPLQAEGRHLLEVVRNADLQRFVGRLMQSQQAIEEEIVLRNDGQRYLQLHGSVLRDAAGRDIGALMVLNDVTRIRRIEAVRRDFVANVSHELRTPITSIQGFVETLREGAIHDVENAGRFLEIIANQADRLNAIIEDLLQLSGLEQEGEKAKVEMADARLKSVLESAVAGCQIKAFEGRITVAMSCPDDLHATINPPLIERAVINLLDNAIKYSGPDSTVFIEAQTQAGQITLRVRDTGCGIDAEHLPRLFERFYRVDKARSRKLGGTGLGLAIVKHIAQVHGGTVSVESAPGKGSTFEIRIPGAGR
jgi:two-component system phosphate regulon sensor histidine kinase PhoR